MPAKQSIPNQLAQKTFQELGYDPKTKSFTPSPVPSRKLPINSRHLPFRIPAIEKTQRQWTKDTGYKASAAWQTASLLRDLVLLWTTEYLPESPHANPRTIARLRAQLDDAARSMVSTFEEGWARPSTKEFLDFIGFSQASLVEIHGDMERCLTDGLIQSERELIDTRNLREFIGSPMAKAGIPTPSRNFPYPPVNSRRFPARYGRLRERLREFTGKTIQPKDLSYELFIELTNKVSYLFRRTVEGLWGKLSRDEQEKLRQTLKNIWQW